jgi:hypothetical protein
LVPCPIAKFGCTSEVPHSELSEHYSSQIHQAILLKAVEVYVRELHNSPCDHQINLEFNHSEVLDSIDILAEGVSSLHDESVELHTNNVQLLSCLTEQQRHIERLSKSIADNSQIFHAAQMNNNILQTEIDTMKQMLSDSSSLLSNDGSYIWKISNVADKLANAIAERQTSIYSPPFYSSSTGYKMCMRLYLNGDGQAKKTHLSLFFVLMRGEYDGILTWPFQHKIMFCLYDQTIAKRHIIDSFRPDIKSNSFQRPRSNMNIASGIPKFLPSSIIQQENNSYVRDDCMFIRCIVDFASMPKVLIPYMTSLNPGLPMSIQQNMIQSETEKHHRAIITGSSSTDSTKTDDLKGNI